MAQEGTAAGSLEPATGSRTTERPTGQRARRTDGIRIFSSASDAPRSRRPTDAIMLALAVLAAIALSFPARCPTATAMGWMKNEAHL
jgi:hypothetical protein